MAEKRRSRRVDGTIQLKGKLYHVIDFKVKNISLGGINILCNFQPHVGSLYTIFLMHNGVTQDFQVQILRCEFISPSEREKTEEDPNLMLSIGAKFIDLNGERRQFLDSMLKKTGYEKGIGYLADEEAYKNNQKNTKSGKP